MCDLISRQAVIDTLEERLNVNDYSNVALVSELNRAICYVKRLPARPELLLTDREQRIFLAAMEREEEVCKAVDKKHIREAYEDSLTYTCKEIKRKVKGALWI